MPEQPGESSFRPVDYLERMTRALEGINEKLGSLDESIEVISDVFATVDTALINYPEKQRVVFAEFIRFYQDAAREDEDEPEENPDSA